MYNLQYPQYAQGQQEQRVSNPVGFPPGVSPSYTGHNGTTFAANDSSPQWIYSASARQSPSYASELQMVPIPTYSVPNSNYDYAPAAPLQSYPVMHQHAAVSVTPPAQDILSQGMTNPQDYSDPHLRPPPYLLPPEGAPIPNPDYGAWMRQEELDRKPVVATGQSWESPHAFNHEGHASSEEPPRIYRHDEYGSSEESSSPRLLYPASPEERKPRFSSDEDSDHSPYRSSTSVSDAYRHQSMANAPEDWVNQSNQMVMHPYVPVYGNQAAPAGDANRDGLIAIFKQHPDGGGRIRAPNTACYHCKHRRIKCDERIYDANGRPYCGSCCQRQGPCYWPPRFYAYLEADYIAAQRARLAISDPVQLRDPGLDDRLRASFDPSKCPRRLSWTWRRNEQTGRFEFDDVPPTGNERIPKRRKTLDEYWWDQW